jgi:hypothetical protein
MDVTLCPTLCQGITIVKELFLFTLRQLLPRKRFRSTSYSIVSVYNHYCNDIQKSKITTFVKIPCESSYIYIPVKINLIYENLTRINK